MKNALAVLLVLISTSSACLAQSDRGNIRRDSETESIVLVKERQKWDALRLGRWSSVEALYADDCISIGYDPDLTVSRTTRQESFGKAGLGPADFTLSDIKVITSNRDTAVITYIARGTVNTAPGPTFAIYATSVWVKRAGEWKTIFYQASLKN